MYKKINAIKKILNYNNIDILLKNNVLYIKMNKLYNIFCALLL